MARPLRSALILLVQSYWSLDTIKIAVGLEQEEDAGLTKKKDARVAKLYQRRTALLAQLAEMDETLGKSSDDDEDEDSLYDPEGADDEEIYEDDPPMGGSSGGPPLGAEDHDEEQTSRSFSYYSMSFTSCAEGNACGKFVRHNPCQCNPKCSHFGNCCSDYETACASPAAPVAPSGFTSCKEGKACGKFVRHNSCQCTSSCRKYGNCCSDYNKACTTGTGPGYHPHNPELLSPSPAPLYTFYMYRAQKDESYPPKNTNMASLSGVLWYLQNEVVNRCDSGRGSGDKGYRRFKISRILRYKVQTRAPKPLFDLGMNFGSRVAFDYGKNTGAFFPYDDMKKNYEYFGYNVGCSTLGDTESSPYPKCPSNEGKAEGFCPVMYPNAYWYSMPGHCPEKKLEDKTAACDSKSPGGFCKGEPTGQGNCTWTYEDAGDVNLDEVVGISPKYGTGEQGHKNFCRKNCLEYVKYGGSRDKGRCITWWDHRMDKAANQKRMDDVDAAFKKKYPDMASEKDYTIPKCDFHKSKFYSTLKHQR